MMIKSWYGTFLINLNRAEIRSEVNCGGSMRAISQQRDVVDRRDVDEEYPDRM